ncbi:MAG: hypothetical protein E7219_00335 [Clostridiales bacterium]|nr:hypothetical protein [Clostridiales bacterium]
MKDNAALKLKTIFEDLIRDRKRLVKVLSVAAILLMALILRIHGANKADVTVETQEATLTDTSVQTDGPDSYNKIIFVDLAGAVVKPGVYEVTSDTRLFRVIEMAGGLTEEADTNSVNQASFVQDGEKIIIPSKSDQTSVSAETSQTPVVDPTLGLININIASKEELTTLNGIGDVMAERIIEYRASNRFKNKEDIMSVKGIGTGIYEKIKDKIIC